MTSQPNSAGGKTKPKSKKNSELPFVETEFAATSSDDLAQQKQSAESRIKSGSKTSKKIHPSSAQTRDADAAVTAPIVSTAITDSNQLTCDVERLQERLRKHRCSKHLHKSFGAWPLAAVLWSTGNSPADQELIDQLKALKKWYRRLVDEQGKYRNKSEIVTISYPANGATGDVVSDFYQSEKEKSDRAALTWLNCLEQQRAEGDRSRTALQRTIATAMLLPLWSVKLDANGFAALWKQLVDCVTETQVDWSEDPEHSLLCGVELPAILNSFLWHCEIELPLQLADCWDDCERWYESLANTLDNEGWPTTGRLELLPFCLAAHTRIALWHQFRDLEIPEDAQTQWEWLLRNGLRSCWNRQGEALFASDRWQLDDDLLRAWRQLTTDDDEQAVLDQWLGERAESKLVAPERSVLRDSAYAAVFRGDWRHKSPKFAMRYDRGNCWLELTNRVALLRGSCLPQFSCDDQPLNFTRDQFELNCWHTEDELDYLEIEMPLSGGFVWQRQIAFARYDRFLFLADALLGETSGQLSYAGEFPVAAGLDVAAESETRELYLRDDEIQALVLPISMGEWQQDHTGNHFIGQDGRIMMRQRQRGRALFAAFVVDLDVKRCQRPRTWRNLTVGQSLQTARPDEAVASRFQLDDQQYLMYRSLGRIANRTFLGVNVYCDFYLGRFDRDGEAESLISIE